MSPTAVVNSGECISQAAGVISSSSPMRMCASLDRPTADFEKISEGIRRGILHAAGGTHPTYEAAAGFTISLNEPTGRDSRS